MTESKVNELAAKLSQVKDPADRQGIFSLLATRIAEGVESGEAILTKGTLTDAWDWANNRLFDMAAENPKRAFNFSVMLTTLPHEDGKQGRINDWLRGQGMTLLGENDSYVGKLEWYLPNGSKGPELLGELTHLMKADISHVKTKPDANGPEGFNGLAAVNIGLGFKGSSLLDAKELYKLALAQRQVKTPQFELYLKEFPEVKFLARRFNQ